jgi:prepilin-type N-terminal cleavage/methylation domain-containing protein
MKTLVIPPHLPLEKGGMFPLYQEGIKGCVPPPHNPHFFKGGLGGITNPLIRIHSPRGFTLLEVLVATAILGIAVAVVLQLFSANLRALALSEDYVSATKRAEAKMREILDDAALTETSFSETTTDGMRTDVSVTDALPERTETLPVKLLEVSLTVHWTKGTKERSLTIRTMKAVKKEQVL